MTAGGYNNIPLLLRNKPFIFGLYHGSADCSLLNVIEAKLLDGFAHWTYTGVVVGDKGGGKADYYRIAALQKNLYLFGLVNNLLSVLRADNKALSA